MKKNTLDKNFLSPNKPRLQIKQKKTKLKNNQLDKSNQIKITKPQKQKQLTDNTQNKRCQKKLIQNKKMEKNGRKINKQSNQYDLTQYQFKRTQQVTKQKTLKKLLVQKVHASSNHSNETKHKLMNDQSQKNINSIQKSRKTQNNIRKYIHQSIDNHVKNLQDSRSNQKQKYSFQIYAKDCQSPKIQRYKKFQIRSQKYSKIMQELKTSHATTNVNSKQQKQQHLLHKPKSCYKKRMEKLSKQIQTFRAMGSKSQKALKKMEVLLTNQQKLQRKQRQAFMNEIMKIKQQLLQYKPNLGHLFSYPQFKPQDLVPQIIPEGPDESKLNYNKIMPHTYQQLVQKGQKIVNQYSSNQSIDQSQVNEVCLSLSSKQSQD